MATPTAWPYSVYPALQILPQNLKHLPPCNALDFTLPKSSPICYWPRRNPLAKVGSPSLLFAACRS